MIGWLTCWSELKPFEQPNAVVALAKVKFCDSIYEFDHDPTDPECPTRQRSSYCRWMFVKPVDGKLVAPAYLQRHNTSIDKKQAVARCRMGAIPLQVNLQHNNPYPQRVCLRCNQAAVDSTPHMLFECDDSGLCHARSSYPELFEDIADVHKLMQAAYDPSLVGSLVDCISIMIECLEG